MCTESQGISLFERYLSVWVIGCILIGIALGKAAPDVALYLDGLSIKVGGAPVVSMPIAACLFFYDYPIMVKIDFAEILKVGKSIKPVTPTLVINWLIKPFTMYALCVFFLALFFILSLEPMRLT